MASVTTTTSGSTMGWTVVGDGATFGADGQLMPRRFKWSAFAPHSGSWGYEDSHELAVERAREEFARLTGEEG